MSNIHLFESRTGMVRNRFASLRLRDFAFKVLRLAEWTRFSKLSLVGLTWRGLGAAQARFPGCRGQSTQPPFFHALSADEHKSLTAKYIPTLMCV